jgi:hypothetical protein
MAGLTGLVLAAAAALSVRSLLKSWQEWLWRFFAFVGLLFGIQLVLVSLLRWFAPESPRLADSPFLAYAVSGGLNVPLWICSAVSLFLAAFVGDRLPAASDFRPGRATLVMLALGGLCFAPAALVLSSSYAWILPMLSALYAVAVVCVLTYEVNGASAFFRLSPVAFLVVVTLGTEIVCLSAFVRVREVPKDEPVAGEPRRGIVLGMMPHIQCTEAKAFPHGVSELTDVISGTGSGRCDTVSVSGTEVPPGGGMGAVCGIANCMGLPNASSLFRILPSADARLCVPKQFGAGKDALVQVVITNPTAATVMASIEMVPGDRLRLVGDSIKGMNVEARTRRATQFTITSTDVLRGEVTVRVKLDGRIIERRAFVDVVSGVESNTDVLAGRLDGEKTAEFEARAGWAQSGGMLRCAVFGGAECAVLEGCMEALDSRGADGDGGDCIAAAARLAVESAMARRTAGALPSQGVQIAEFDSDTSGRTWRAYQRLVSFVRKDGLFALDSKDGRGSAVATAFALRALQRVDVHNGKNSGNGSVADAAAAALRQGFDKDAGWRDDAFAARAGVKDAENAGLFTTSLVARALAFALPKGAPVLTSAEGLIASRIRGDTNPLALAASLDALMALNPSASAIQTALSRVDSLRRGTAGRCWWTATEGSAAGGWDRMSTVLVLDTLRRGGHWKNDVDAGMMFLVGDIWTRRFGEDPSTVLAAALLADASYRSSDRSDRSDAMTRTDVFMNGTFAWSCGGTGAEWSDARDLRDAVLSGPNRIRLVPAAPPKSGGSESFFVLRRTEPGRGLKK